MGQRVSPQPGILMVQGLEDAFLGTTLMPSESDDDVYVDVAVYDAEKIVVQMMGRDGMSREGAEESFDYNIDGAWVGELTPIYTWEPPRLS